MPTQRQRRAEWQSNALGRVNRTVAKLHTGRIRAGSSAHESGSPMRRPEESLLDRHTTANRPLAVSVTSNEAMACARYLLAEHLAVHEASERAEVMWREVERQRADLVRLCGDRDPLALVTSHLAELERAERTRFLVEMFFLDPYAGAGDQARTRDHIRAVRKLAAIAGDSPDLIDRIEKTAARAQKVGWLRVGLIGIGGAAAMGLGGFVVAPAVGTAIGAGMGLSGAAATNFGLSLLGGGAVAAGGSGVAGGMWLVAASGAALGGTAGIGAGTMFRIGAERTRAELAKAHVLLKLIAVDGQIGQLKAQEVLLGLHREHDRLRGQLAEERRLNDENASKLRLLEITRLREAETARMDGEASS